MPEIDKDNETFVALSDILYGPDTTVTLAELEEIAIRGRLQVCNGNIRQAIKLLGISRSTMYRKLYLYGLER